MAQEARSAAGTVHTSSYDPASPGQNETARPGILPVATGELKAVSATQATPQPERGIEEAQVNRKSGIRAVFLPQKGLFSGCKSFFSPQNRVHSSAKSSIFILINKFFSLKTLFLKMLDTLSQNSCTLAPNLINLLNLNNFFGCKFRVQVGASGCKWGAIDTLLKSIAPKIYYVKSKGYILGCKGAIENNTRQITKNRVFGPQFKREKIDKEGGR